MRSDIWIYVFVMALVTYLIRMLPLTLFRKEIKSRFVRSVLYYVPYACLAAMTVPAIFYATSSVISGVCALVAAALLAFARRNMLLVALVSCGVVFVVERILSLFS